MRYIGYIVLIIWLIICPCIGLAADWYVDNAASGTNSGTSWTNAWQDLDEIVWASISPGDTVYISGGTTSKTYTSQLIPTKNGTAGAYITIKPGQSSPHNGVVTITTTGLYSGIDYKANYITVDGRAGETPYHIRVTGCGQAGVMAGTTGSGSSYHHDRLLYVQVDNNGGSHGTGYWNSGICVVNPSTNSSDEIIEVGYCLIYDNYQDHLHFENNYYPSYGRYNIHHNEMYNSHDDGVEINGTGLDYYNNYNHDLVTPIRGHSDGVQADGGYCRVYNNVMENLSNPNAEADQVNSCMVIAAQTIGGYAADPWYGSTHAIPQSNWLIYNNICWDDNETASSVYYRGIYFTMGPNSPALSADNALIANNTIVGSHILALGIYNTTGVSTFTNMKLVNNIIYNCGRLTPGSGVLDVGPTSSVGSYGSSANVQVDYNIIHSGSSGGHACKNGSTTYSTPALFASATSTQSHMSSLSYGDADPLLDANYYLSAGSPAIDAAADLTTFFTTDINSNDRPGNWDIGAYEYATTFSGKVYGGSISGGTLK